MEFTSSVMHLTDMAEPPPVCHYEWLVGTVYGAITQEGITAYRSLEAAFAKEQSEELPAAGGSGNCCF